MNSSTNESLFAYFKDLKAQMVYKKFDNAKFYTIPCINVSYFAGFFFNLKKITQDYKGEPFST